MYNQRRPVSKDSLYLIIIIILFGLNLLSIFMISRLYILLPNLKTLDSRLQITTETSIKSIEESGNNIQREFENQFSQATENLIKNQLQNYKNELGKIISQLQKTHDEYEGEKQRLERLENGLPEQVDIDDLQNRYSGNKPDETFLTSKGKIYFFRSEIDVVIVPSTKKAAWIRIGKKNSQENSELIKAWLDESAKSKLQQGYKLRANRTRDSDYGEYTEKIYRKKDMYFKTYFQYERIQGTYGRYSLQYTFYVETGSEVRKQRYVLEQYTNRLGS